MQCSGAHSWQQTPRACTAHTGRDDPLVSTFGHLLECTTLQHASRHLVAGNVWKCIVPGGPCQQMKHQFIDIPDYMGTIGKDSILGFSSSPL